jgi:L-fuconolactonase
MLVDAHTHVFELWPFAPVPDPKFRGSAELLCHEMNDAKVDRALVIASTVGGNHANNSFILSAAARHGEQLVPFLQVCPRAKAGHPSPLDQLRLFTDSGLFAGLTMVVDEPAWLLTPEADALLAVVAELRLPVNLALSAAGFPCLADCARRHSEVTFLINEMGNARIVAREPSAAYLAQVLTIRDCSNVLLKLSGFPRLAAEPWDFPFLPWLWLIRLWRDHVGAERLCWGSEYPAVLQHLTYRQSLEIIRTHATFLSPAERRLILGGNVSRILRLPEPALQR